jgi:predicted enzyme related to lactoylglutathione lyase
MTTMSVGMITFDTTDASALAAWWARHTGGTVHDDNGGWFVTVSSDGPTLAFQKIEDPTPGKNRIHLDLHVPDRAATAQGLLADGATLVAEREMPGFCWTVLADPDGNQFCLAQEDGA